MEEGTPIPHKASSIRKKKEAKTYAFASII
jgi:hypothetical protein